MKLKFYVLAVMLACISLSAARRKNKSTTTTTTERSSQGSTLVPPIGHEVAASTYCELDDGSQGFCVQSYLCEDREINDDGAGLISERKLECRSPTVCCKPKNETTTMMPTPSNNRHGKATHCELQDGRIGYCAQPHLCRTRRSNDGAGLITERTLQCATPEVCCERDHESLMSSSTTMRPRTLVPPVTSKKHGGRCEAYDGSPGRCVFLILCNNDTTIVDGSGLITERTADPCPNWNGGIQICCPDALLKGKIIPDIDSTTQKISRTNDNDDSCITSDHSEGTCVPHYQCSEDFDGSGVINARYQGVCPVRSICCKREHVDLTKSPPTPAGKKACGIVNKDGLWPCSPPNCPKVEALEAKFGEFPWMVAVRTKTARFPEHYNTTGGSLIHPSVVLTVAHYVGRAVDKDVTVRAGEWNILDVDEPLPHQEVAVKTIVSHPDFNKNNYRNDIALLFLESPIRLLPHVGVVCLPAAGELVAPSTDCVTNGWGKDRHGKKGAISHILKKLTLPAVDHQDCQTRLRTTRLGPFFQLHDGFMCAGGDRLDACSLDGGSPLTCPTESDENRYVQQGVVAWGIDCHMPNIPGVYMNVGHYRTWIDQHVKAEGLDTSVYSI